MELPLKKRMKSRAFKLFTLGMLLTVSHFATRTTYAQTVIWADSVASEWQTDNSQNAIDGNLNTFSEVRANSGSLLGIGSYSGYVEVRFPSLVPANQTSYVKIEADDDILQSLLGGSIGNLLAQTTGILLSGNQEFGVQVKNGTNVVLSGYSANPADFSGEQLKIVVNRYNEMFLAVTPSQDYNCIRITCYVGALIGASTTKSMQVFGAYYVQNAAQCGDPSFTSYDAWGLTIDLVQLSGAGATDIYKTIDENWYSFSELSLGAVSTPAIIEQKVYFEGLSDSTELFGVRFSVDPQLAVLNLGSQITFRAQNGAITEYTETLGNLLTPAMTDSLQNGDIVTVFLSPGVPVDRVALNYASILGVNLNQFIHFHEVFKLSPAPIYDITASNDTVCKGTTAQLAAIASDPSMEIHWYLDSLGGTMIGTSPSGALFDTPPLFNDTTFYAAAARPGCPDETDRIPVAVSIIPSPMPADINLNVDPAGYCAADTIVIAPNSLLGDQFSWYFDGNATQPITDGMQQNGATFGIDASGNLTIVGLDPNNAPFDFFIAVQDSATLCYNAPGDLADALVDLTDEPAPTTNNAAQSFCATAGATIADIQVNEPNVNWYDAPGGGNLLTPSTVLIDGVSYYATTVGAQCESSDSLMIAITIEDEPTPTTNDTQQDFCSSDAPTVGDIQVNEPNINWYDAAVNGNPVSPSTPLTNGAIFYASAVGANCESSTLLAISVTVDNLPAPTTQDSTQVFCVVNNPIIDDIDVNETGIVWYTAPSGGQVIPAGTPLQDGVSYYATQVVGTCESAGYLEVEVSFEQVSPPTTSQVVQIFCAADNATVGDLSVNEPNIVWYDAAVNGNPVNPSTPLTNNTSYYAAQVGTYCESITRLMIYVTIEDVPAPTTINTTQSFCTAIQPTIDDLDVNEPNVVWYDGSGNPLPVTTPLVNGATYYAAQVGANCESSNQLAISVEVVDQLSADITGETTDICLSDTITYTTDPGMVNYTWNVVGGTVISGGTSFDNSVTVVWQNAPANTIQVSYETLNGCFVTMPNFVDITIVSCSDLTISKTVDVEEPFVGDEVVFTIGLNNNGLDAFINLIIDETLPSGFTYVSYVATHGTYDPFTGLWTIPSLPAGAHAEMKITVTVNPSGEYMNVVTIKTSDPFDMDMNNNTAHALARPSCLSVYNEISPNGDGVNDYLIIDCIENYPNNSVDIFNRYGNLIYHVEGYGNDWDGVANVNGVIGKGEVIPTGTYYYILRVEDEDFEGTGWIYIVRE